MSDRYDWRKDMDSIEACEDVWDCADGCCTNIMPRHNDEAIRLAAHIEALEADLDTANTRADEAEAQRMVLARRLSLDGEPMGRHSHFTLNEQGEATVPLWLDWAAREAVRR